MSQTPASETVYYRDQYWNDHPFTREYMARLTQCGAGTTSGFWMDYLRERYADRIPFKRALFLNCGNGWAERDLFDRGVFRHGVGFDYSHQLLAQARAQAGPRPLDYFQADCNAVWFNENEFDAVFNVAAMHHVQYIDRMHRELAKALTPDGLLVGFDYIGPHRNQYSPEVFDVMQRVAAQLPPGFRPTRLLYPHLPTMLMDDPTEAIHSELSMLMFERYFTPIERKDLGGGIAYSIMHNNAELFWDGSEIAQQCVRFLLTQDELLTAAGVVPPLFSFYVGKPKKSVLADHAAIERYSTEEHEREDYAKANGGLYYTPGTAG